MVIYFGQKVEVLNFATFYMTYTPDEYKRNLRIFSNLNQIPITKDDRLLIIIEATHIAFLNKFIQISPKYQLINVS